MKRMLGKTLFISLLFSAVVPSTMQANSDVKSGVVISALVVTTFAWNRLALTRQRNATRNLWKATKKGNVDKTKQALKNRARVDQKNKLGWTPLIQAASDGHLEIAELLVINKANINQQTKEGWTPLMHSASGGHLEITKLLLKHNSAINTQNKPFGWTPLMCAEACDHPETVKLLIAKNANLHIKNFWGETVLIRAKTKGNQKTIALLEEAHRKETFNTLRKILLEKKELEGLDKKNIYNLIAEFTY